jgi:hypothetical protein
MNHHTHSNETYAEENVASYISRGSDLNLKLDSQEPDGASGGSPAYIPASHVRRGDVILISRAMGLGLSPCACIVRLVKQKKQKKYPHVIISGIDLRDKGIELDRNTLRASIVQIIRRKSDLIRVFSGVREAQAFMLGCEL